ncbi:hypothetical protein POM88_011117 [Heracleum sosnowskyi]|uniref:Uncharacterized protein n=1 Tax=Heracleum sosnowskyi TaxID=360622 RepID=A0AAD8IUX3_9APIA|nr:hypothetical protein POM88_011117 [Heracleum sosnowskyi]
MASTAFVSSGLEFVPNNYAAPLATVNAPEAFHLMQNFLAQSPIGRALVEPQKLSGSQIKSFWEYGVYDDGGDSGTPSIVFEFKEAEYVIPPGTVRDAMGFDEQNAYTITVGDADLVRMMREIGYGGSLTKIGQLKRPFLRKEWSFFFDCITRTFGKKCTNWDSIPTDSLQIGYSLIYGTHFDFGRLILINIDIVDGDVIPCFKLHKCIFSDLVNKDVKKGNVGDFLLPALVQQFLDDSIQTELQPEPLNTEVPPSTSQPIRTGGRVKHRAFKPAKSVKPTTEVGVSKTSVPNSVGSPKMKSVKKSRAKRPRSDNEDDTETLTQRRRRLISDYLFDEVDTEAVSEAVPVDVPEAELNVDPDVVIQDAAVDVEATVPTEDRANADVHFEADNEAANADNFIDQLDMDFEAHPAISVCDTEDVAADQATLEVNYVSSEKIIEGAVEKMNVATAENKEERVAEEVNTEKNEAVAEQTLDEAAQSNVEITAENVVEEAAEPLVENVVENRVVSDSHDHTSVNSDHADSDESIPFLRDPTAENVKENQTATEAH